MENLPKIINIQVSWTYQPQEEFVQISWRTRTGGNHTEPIRCPEDWDEVPESVRNLVTELLHPKK